MQHMAVRTLHLRETAGTSQLLPLKESSCTLNAALAVIGVQGKVAENCPAARGRALGWSFLLTVPVFRGRSEGVGAGLPLSIS
ncbi:hypothetical protein GDO78_021178 [Eleutherodactylus coqui]|uniref:Uncharacterized protein n=1 Tax=Eleutherodactylus coqui TaxID=57060 RepID=A0A8J6E8F5_ELECQ|nr:hypothetical protein GDO78_021178 [Eleutherodactylus coqui]